MRSTGPQWRRTRHGNDIPQPNNRYRMRVICDYCLNFAERASLLANLGSNRVTRECEPRRIAYATSGATRAARMSDTSESGERGKPSHTTIRGGEVSRLPGVRLRPMYRVIYSGS